ncbi:MAG: hypothetical protein KGO93_08240 [Cyanobacteria bacterium REEB446]|nr:hypothetical protein [Cyanobacteria bacterium REEB446]
MAGIENSGYNPYALVALKTPKTSGVTSVSGEPANTTEVDTSADTVVINRDNVATPAFKNASNLKEILFANTKIDLAGLRKEAASDNPEISSQANKALKSVSEYSYYQYHEAQGADGFIYVANRGMVPYSNDGVKYPKQEEVQELADKELTHYILVSQTTSADNVLKAMQATGKPLTQEQQQKVAELLKEEARNMKPEEVAKIKGQLSDAYTSLIPDYPEHDALRKNVAALIKNLNKVPNDSINSTWASAINGENTIFELNSIEQELKNYQPPARSRLFLPEEELQLV